MTHLQYRWSPYRLCSHFFLSAKKWTKKYPSLGEGAQDLDLGGCTPWFGVTTSTGKGVADKESGAIKRTLGANSPFFVTYYITRISGISARWQICNL